MPAKKITHEGAAKLRAATHLRALAKTPAPEGVAAQREASQLFGEIVVLAAKLAKLSPHEHAKKAEAVIVAMGRSLVAPLYNAALPAEAHAAPLQSADVLKVWCALAGARADDLDADAIWRVALAFKNPTLRTAAAFRRRLIKIRLKFEALSDEQIAKSISKYESHPATAIAWLVPIGIGRSNASHADTLKRVTEVLKRKSGKK